jgi:hypothetical protein
MNIIKPYLNTSFLFHENGLDNLEKNTNKIYYNLILPKKTNTWVSFNEPDSSVIDRFASNNNKVTKILVKRNNSSTKAILCDFTVSEQKELNNKNNKSNINNNINHKKKEKIKIKLKDIWKKPDNKIIIKNNILNDINNNIKKREDNDNKIIDEKKDYILEIPGTYIPYEKNEKINILLNNTEENDLLRKEREKKIFEKEEKIKNEKYKKKSKDLRILNRQFNCDKLTFDPNGNIIKLHLPHVDSFKKDFIESNLKIKGENPPLTDIKPDINIQRQNIIKKNKILKTKSIIIADSNHLKELKLKLNKKNIKELIEYNPKDKLDIYYNSYNLNNDENNPKVIYSGSNFDKILPEVGVVISKDNDNNNDNSINKEKDKKVGGFEYIKKYNRPSMNEISNYLLSQNTSNNNEQISSFFNNDYKNNQTNNNKVINTNDNKNDEKNNLQINQLNTDNNYIGYKEEFNDNNNPLFYGAVQIKDESQKNQKIYNNQHLLPLRIIKDKKSFSNENIFISNKKNNNPHLKKNISQINPLFNKRKLLINNKLYFQSNNNINIKNNNSKEKYLSSMNSIILSENFNSPNLKSIFIDEEENHIMKKDNKIDNKNNLINIKCNSIELENNKEKFKILYPLKKLKYQKYKLPVITEINNNHVNKNAIEQKYINKFNLRIIKDKNWGNDNNYNNIDSNEKNSYKEQFLRKKNQFMKNPRDFKLINKENGK